MSQILLSGSCHLASKVDPKSPNMRCVRFQSVPPTIDNRTIRSKSSVFFHTQHVCYTNEAPKSVAVLMLRFYS